jgi:hypothetical protein
MVKNIDKNIFFMKIIKSKSKILMREFINKNQKVTGTSIKSFS